MILVSLSKASSLPGAPDKSHLSRISKRPNRPNYFVQDARGYWQVDLEHPDWLTFLEARTGEKQLPPEREEDPQPTQSLQPAPKTTTKKPRTVGAKAIKNMGELQLAKIQEDVRGKQIENEIKFLDLQKSNGNIMDKSLAEFLYLGHIERCDREKFRFPNKIKGEIELEIQGAIKAKKDPSDIASAIVKIILREEEAILRDIRKAQDEDVKNWKEENGIR